MKLLRSRGLAGHNIGFIQHHKLQIGKILRQISLMTYKTEDPEKKRIISEAVTAEVCKIIESGYSPSIAIRHVNKKSKVSYDTIYYILSLSHRYIRLVDEIKRERDHRHRKFIVMRSIAV